MTAPAQQQLKPSSRNLARNSPSFSSALPSVLPLLNLFQTSSPPNPPFMTAGLDARKRFFPSPPYGLMWCSAPTLPGKHVSKMESFFGCTPHYSEADRADTHRGKSWTPSGPWSVSWAEVGIWGQQYRVVHFNALELHHCLCVAGKWSLAGWVKPLSPSLIFHAGVLGTVVNSF